MRKYLLFAIGFVALALLAVVCRKDIKIWYRRVTAEISTGRFQDPEGLAIDAAGNIYVADEDWQRFTVLDPKGKTLVSFRYVEGYTVDGKPALITTGDSMAVLGNGHVVIIAQFDLAELKIQDGKVSLVRSYGKFGDPEGIARDPTNGDLYVTDEDNRRIEVFTTSGKPLRGWPVPQDPEGICVTKDRVYLTFSKDDWVGCYTKAGKLQFRFGKKGSGPGQLRNPDFVCVGPDGLLYVTDQKNDRIQIFDLEGHPLRTLGRRGRKAGEFRDPEDLAFDAAGNLIVADGGNHRIQVVTRDGQPLQVYE